MPNWTELKWLCLDTETTGLKAGEDRIIEVGAAWFEQGRCVRGSNALVNPGIPIPESASAIHGITDADVADKEPIEALAPRLLPHVEQAELLVGYNWPFDADFFAAELGEAWEKAIAGKPVIDPLVLVRMDHVGRFWKGKGRHKLESVTQRLGIPWFGQAHRASADCRATGWVLWHLREHLPGDADEAATLIFEARQRQNEDFQRWRASQPPREATSESS